MLNMSMFILYKNRISVFDICTVTLQPLAESDPFAELFIS